MRTIILSIGDVSTIVRHVGLDRLMDETIAALTAACRGYDAARYEVPMRDGFAYEHPQTGLLEWMPMLAGGSTATIKLVGYHPANPVRWRLPTVLSTLLSFDARTGHLRALVDGTFLTAVRTGAASAVASRILGAPQSQVLGLIGCGAQALSQLHALSRVFTLREVLVHDSDPAARESFADRAACLNLCRVTIKAFTSPQAVLRNADILCTATSIGVGEGPVFEDGPLQPHIHVNAVGSDFAGKTELPLALLERSLVCPDFRPQAMVEGECQQLHPDQIGPDMVALVKRAPDHVVHQGTATVFDSTGWALEDHVAGTILLRHARELGCASELDLEAVSGDPRNPYAFVAPDAAPGAGGVSDEAPSSAVG